MYLTVQEIMSARDRAATIGDATEALDWMAFFLLRIGRKQGVERIDSGDKWAKDCEAAMERLKIDESKEPAEPERKTFMQYVEEAS